MQSNANSPCPRSSLGHFGGSQWAGGQEWQAVHKLAPQTCARSYWSSPGRKRDATGQALAPPCASGTLTRPHINNIVHHIARCSTGGPGQSAAPPGIFCQATASVAAALAAMVLAKRDDRKSPMPNSRFQQAARPRPKLTSGPPRPQQQLGGSSEKSGSHCIAPRRMDVVGCAPTRVLHQTKERRIACIINGGLNTNRTIPGRARHNSEFGPTSGPKRWANEHTTAQLGRPPYGWATKARNMSTQDLRSAIDKRMPRKSKPAARTHENRDKRKPQDNANENGG